jgi:hypothetical protein
MNGRGERIRTSDLSVPNRAHYQAVLRPAKLPTTSCEWQGILEARQTYGQAAVNNPIKKSLVNASDLAR